MEKLLFFTNSFKTGGGGVASYAHDFVEAFSHIYEITVITNDDYSTTEYDNFKTVHLNLWDFSVANAKTILAYITNIAPDIIVNSFAPVVSLIVPYINNDIKVVTVSHLTDEKLGYIAGYNASYVDNIIVLSSYAKDYIKNKFGKRNASKAHIIYNFMQPLSAGENIAHKIEAKTLKIVYPGGAASHKSPVVVCKALLRLLKTDLNFEFYWLGNTKLAGSKYRFVKIKNISDLLPKDSRIKHVGGVSRNEAEKIISEANIFLLPSKREGFPISLIEAMRAGCIPVISDAKHGSLDVIRNNKNGLIVKQGDDMALYQAMADIIENHKEYKHIYRNSYETYSSQLSYSIWIDKMYRLFNNKSLSHNDRKICFLLWTFLPKRFVFRMELYKDRMINYSRQISLLIQYRLVTVMFKK